MECMLEGALASATLEQPTEGRSYIRGQLLQQRQDGKSDLVEFYGEVDADAIASLTDAPYMSPVRLMCAVYVKSTTSKAGNRYSRLVVKALRCLPHATASAQAS